VSLRFPLLLACFFLSGFAALLYETAWMREFGFVFGTSELAIAAVLAAYMAGLALGAACAGRWVHRLRRPVLVYGALELGIAVCALAVPYGIRAVTALYVALFGGRSTLPEEGGLAAGGFPLLGASQLERQPEAGGPQGKAIRLAERGLDLGSRGPAIQHGERGRVLHRRYRVLQEGDRYPCQRVQH
jgi:spermidine synthase